MKTYRVFGRKYQDYYAIIKAPDEQVAYDYSMNNDNIQWFEVETDDSIEPYEVFLDEDTSEDVQLNNDEWPEMTSGIVITGTN